MKQLLNNDKNRVKVPSEIIRQEVSQAEVRKRNSRNWLESLCVAVWKTVTGAKVVEQEDQETGSVEKGREDEGPSQCALKEQLWRAVNKWSEEGGKEQDKRQNLPLRAGNRDGGTTYMKKTGKKQGYGLFACFPF